MLISMLKYIKIFKGTPTVQRIAPQGSQHTPAIHVLLPQRRSWPSGFLNSVFLNF